MADVNPGLAAKLRSELGVTTRQVNRLIDGIVQRHHLTRPQAALVLASQKGVNFSRFANPEDLQAIRGVGGALTAAPLRAAPATAAIAREKQKGTKARKQPSNSVFVVHGRNEAVRRDLFQFLRDLGLNPIEWNVGKQLTKKASPHNAEVINAIIKKAAGAVVLFCPEEEVTLKREYWRNDDPLEERRTNEQPRPNVLYEAGMAFSTFPASTVIVRVGKIRQFTDIAGVQIINMTDGSSACRQAVATALKTAKLPVDTTGHDWLKEGGFSLATGKRAKSRRKTR